MEEKYIKCRICSHFPTIYLPAFSLLFPLNKLPYMSPKIHLQYVHSSPVCLRTLLLNKNSAAKVFHCTVVCQSVIQFHIFSTDVLNLTHLSRVNCIQIEASPQQGYYTLKSELYPSTVDTSPRVNFIQIDKSPTSGYQTLKNEQYPSRYQSPSRNITHSRVNCFQVDTSSSAGVLHIQE